LLVFGAAAFGCEDPVLPDDGSWFRRSGDRAKVGCHTNVDDDNGQSPSVINCVDGRWVGPTPPCAIVPGNLPTVSPQ